MPLMLGVIYVICVLITTASIAALIDNRHRLRRQANEIIRLRRKIDHLQARIDQRKPGP